MNRASERSERGFTLIELLIVIAVLGILAVAVLSAINPIEQINRSRDTGNRSDAEQLLGAVDRYYATAGYYPWRSSPTTGSDAQAFLRLNSANAWVDDAAAKVLTEKLSSTAVGTAELKAAFVTRITSAGYNYLFVYNEGNPGTSTYVCFNGASQAFQTEAKERCLGTKGSIPSDLPTATVCNISVDGKATQYLTCLP
jgi:prepilin-type N-terminal cleavage/methylation domain-containing protein